MKLEAGQMWVGEPHRWYTGLVRLIETVEESRVTYFPAHEMDDSIITMRAQQCLAKTFKAWIRREKAESFIPKEKIVTLEELFRPYIERLK